VRALYASAWERNWGFVPMTDAELDHLAAELKPILVPELFVFVERQGEAVASPRRCPTSTRPCAPTGGRIFPASCACCGCSAHPRSAHLLMGIRPDQRALGLDALMFHWIWTQAVRWATPGARPAGCSRTTL